VATKAKAEATFHWDKYWAYLSLILSTCILFTPRVLNHTPLSSQRLTCSGWAASFFDRVFRITESSHTILPEQNTPAFRRPFGCLPFLGDREHLDLLSGPFRPLSLRRTPPGGRRSLRDYSPPSILPIPVVMLNTLPRSAGSVHGYKRVLYHSLRSTTSNLNHRLC
jgi:hypothetical protein